MGVEELENRKSKEEEEEEEIQPQPLAQRQALGDDLAEELANNESGNKGNAELVYMICNEQATDEELTATQVKDLKHLFNGNTDVTIKLLTDVIEERGGRGKTIETLEKFDRATQNRYKTIETLIRHLP